MIEISSTHFIDVSSNKKVILWGDLTNLPTQFEVEARKLLVELHGETPKGEVTLVFQNVHSLDASGVRFFHSLSTWAAPKANFLLQGLPDCVRHLLGASGITHLSSFKAGEAGQSPS